MGARSKSALRTLVIGDHELFARTDVRRPTARRRYESRAIDSFLDLNEGDLVVHIEEPVLIGGEKQAQGQREAADDDHPGEAAHHGGERRAQRQQREQADAVPGDDVDDDNGRQYQVGQYPQRDLCS